MVVAGAARHYGGTVCAHTARTGGAGDGGAAGDPRRRRSLPASEAERRYVLAVVLGEWLGLDWRLQDATGTPTSGSVPAAPDGRAVVVPDVLFAH